MMYSVSPAEHEWGTGVSLAVTALLQLEYYTRSSNVSSEPQNSAGFSYAYLRTAMEDGEKKPFVGADWML